MIRALSLPEVLRPYLRILALFVLCAIAGSTLVARTAFAADDAQLAESVKQTMLNDYPGNLGAARKSLQDVVAVCSGRKGCSAHVRAQAHLSLGMVESQLGNADEAKANFATALKANPSLTLPEGATPSMKSQWEEVKPRAAEAAPAAESGDAIPPGWKSAEAFKLAFEALNSDKAGNLEECIKKGRASLALEEQPRTRLHLSSCENRAGKLVDALKDALQALEYAYKRGDEAVTKIATPRVNELRERIPHITFVPPPGVGDLAVKFDERPVPVANLTKRFSIDPGKHNVVAEGTVNGFPATFHQEYDVKERELITVPITLKPPVSDVITPGQIRCMLEAKNQDDVQKCLPQNRKSLVTRIGFDTSGYIDTLAVGVITPALNASLTSPTAGWNVGGNFLVDAVSAASPDIVSTASPPFKERRYAGGLSGGYKPGLYGGQLSFNYSHEPDYISTGGGLALTADLNDKLITPKLAYSYSYDQIGRGPNNFINFLETQEIEGSSTFVLSPTAILGVGATFQHEVGDQSKPYRYVPMFDPGVAARVPKGAIIDLVNRTRLPVRPTEQLPTERNRYALGIRFNKRFNTSTLRVEQRFYIDSWATKASTTDSRYMVDLSRHIRVWPHARLHFQTATNFYQLAYSSVTDANGHWVLPTYRTGDRELSSLFTLTAGGGTRIGLGPPEGDIKYGIVVSGDLMYSIFPNSLYVTRRTALYGTVGFDVEF